MRLWHKNIITSLPREQLVAQWREISAICGAILKNGTSNHILVNYVLDYDYDHLISYAHYVRKETARRDYKTMDKVWNKIVSLKPDFNLLLLEEIFPQTHNLEYLRICYYNLYEKYLRGVIKEEDWKNIEKLKKSIDF